MRALTPLIGLLVLLFLAPLGALAQNAPATLIADNIEFTRAQNAVTASGNVEIFHQGVRLRAQSLSYNGQRDQIRLQGPITLTEENGDTILLADFAELSPDLQNGVLQSARMVMNRQLQIAAAQIDRVDGRYTQLYQTVASSCEVCAANPVPLWQIRARRIVHDQQERQLYFEDAQFRAMGVPIMWFPRLRLPDPTLARATGLLTPEIRSNNRIGTGIRLPYFITLGDHADLTLTPYLTIENNQTLEARYRHAFRNGFIEVNGAISWDHLTPDSTRTYTFAHGWFNLPRDFRLEFNYQTVSDPGYLATYGFSQEDRLQSDVTIYRARRDEYIELTAARSHSLRDSDNNFTLPNHQLNGVFERRYTPAWLGGIATLGASAHAHARRSSTDLIGRDLARFSLSANWRRDWVLPMGLLAAVEANWQGDLYAIRQDLSYEPTTTRSSPALAVELRWPLARVSDRGVTHLIEPVLQYVWAPDNGALLPNEDGNVVEFDEGNLFSLNRFPGADERELGPRLAFGITYTRDDPDGWSLGLTFGRVFRSRDYWQYTPGSGLDGAQSDWLVSANLELGTNLILVNRTIVSDAFNVTSNELALNWSGARFDFTSAVTWLRADPAEGRPQNMAEWVVDARYDFARAWRAEVDWRYDFETHDTTRAGLSLTYATECADMRFSLSRRFTSSANLPAATDIGVSVALNGFGTTRDGRGYNRSCRR